MAETRIHTQTQTRAQAQDTVLEVRDLVVAYGETEAVSGVSLTVPARCLTALVGPSGCGKTSLLRAVAGFEEPAAGCVEIGGVKVSGDGCWVPPERRQVGMVFQEGALFPHLSVIDNVLYGLRRRPDAEDRAQEALRLVGMVELRHRYPDELSGGQQQRVAVARALAPSPQIVLLDEPFASLDKSLRERVRQEVREILETAGMTAVLVTHDQEEALSFAEQIVVMSAGVVLQIGDPETIYQQPASAEVARFIGEGQLVDCVVENGRAKTVFGMAETSAADGQGLMLVRPEDLVVMPECYFEGLTGTVTRRQFYGHDLVDEIRLDNDGRELLVRSLSSTPHPVGSRVRLCLRPKPFAVFLDGVRGS